MHFFKKIHLQITLSFEEFKLFAINSTRCSDHFSIIFLTLIWCFFLSCASEPGSELKKILLTGCHAQSLSSFYLSRCANNKYFLPGTPTLLSTCGAWHYSGEAEGTMFPLCSSSWRISGCLVQSRWEKNHWLSSGEVPGWWNSHSVWCSPWGG